MAFTYQIIIFSGDFYYKNVRRLLEGIYLRGRFSGAFIWWGRLLERAFLKFR